MKKQFLLIALAIFAGVTVYGQINHSAPRPTGLLDGPGTPIAGKPYTYEATGTPAGGNFLFWATKDANFIATDGAGVTTNNLATRLTTPTDLIAAGANYGVAGAATSVSITWSDATLNGTGNAGGKTPTFVAAHYTAPAAGCADNFNAWEIQPIKAFTVDVKNIDATGAGAYDATPLTQCADIVRSATYVGGTINYIFGTNTFYFEVVSANFSGSWTPTLAVVGLDAVESDVIEWTAADPSTWTSGTVWNAASTPVVPATSVTDLSLGVSIYVRVIVTHNNYEGIADRPITLQVDGLSLVGDYDVLNNLANGSAVSPATPTTGVDQMDIALQTIKARPIIAPKTPATFLPDNKKN